MTLFGLCQVEEHDVRWIADRRVMSREGQLPCFGIHAEHGDVVAPLVAGIEELASGIETKAARIISTGPFLPHEGQLTAPANGEYPDAVMQTVAGIDEPPIAGHQDLG